ncbi:hypothetical protein COV06_01560 [Candidatus Uhrbacteria bacterium CG10_big_fil_rev_8_21_14_0_10_50_16]|uniref:PPM-type phosphatase domain-containing protein n=1 Tax=Candidatus Uhrbacteria bacterium CG10_big_fil_rev_8_21_14_0_10_50_16 TaxID=1975039 RepID=A0A2H0RNP3_9BACT|nr:MAG: hypothetical protein COV06_01560 [Candidatus Uhrbacteria bacterium CG10_big_fil_rev_8_21_14_0_10_50_16]
MLRGKPRGTFLTFTQPLEHNNGHVFLLLDLDATCKVAPNVIALLRESVERLGRTLSAESHLQHRFEQVLQSVNEDLSELIEKGVCPTESLHIALGVLRDGAFILSATGELNALFLRKTAKQRFRVFDLSQNLQSEAGKIEERKLFSVVLDGDLQADDVLFLASRELQNVLTVEEIHPLLSTLPPASALEAIEQYLPVKTHLSIVLFQVRVEKDILTGFGKHTTGKSSMNALLESERKTTSMLELEKPHVQQTFSQFVRLVRSGNAIERKETLRRIGERLLHWIKILGSQAFHILTSIAVSVVSLLSAIVTRGSRRERSIKNMKSTWGRTINSIKAQFHHAGWGSRLLLISGIVFVVLFSSITAYTRFQTTSQTEREVITATFDEIQSKRDRAHASNLYQDEAAARQQLQEALSLLDTIDTKKQTQKDQVEQVRAGILEDLNVIRHLLQPTITTIPVVNQVIASGEKSTVYFRDGSQANLNGSTLEPAERTGEETGYLRLVTTYNDTVVGLDEHNTFLAYHSDTQSWSRVGINSVEGEFTDAVDLFHYGERLYVLTSSNLYRHQRVENGEYGPGTSWLQDPVDLSQVQAIAIDGNVWLADNGSVRRLEQGREVGADMSSIDPPLGAVRDLWTNAETPFLFILDPANKRVIVYNKETQTLVNQYVDDAIGSAFGMRVDIANKTIILYAPTTVYTFPLSDTL